MTKPPHIPPPQIPDLRYGTLLNLKSGEWSHCHKLPDSAYCDLKLVKVHPGITREEDGHTWVWVAGHGIECSWDSSDCVRPCIELMVRLDALQRHAR